jgi:hypothetical protein
MLLVMRFRLTALGSVLAAALLAAGCGGGGSGPSGAELPVRSLASSAKQTSLVDSYRMELHMEMSMPGIGEAIGMTAEGEVDTKLKRQSMTLDMSEMFEKLAAMFGGAEGLPSADQLKMDMVLDGTVAYMRVPFLTGQLGGKNWFKIDIARMAAKQGVDLSSLLNQSYLDPSQYLDYLTSSTGPLQTIGPDTVRGVDTTHVQATLDLGAYLEQLDPKLRQQIAPLVDQFVEMTGGRRPTVDAWVDGDGYVRRMALGLSMSLPGQAQQPQQASVSMVIDLFDFGGDVFVEIPPASDVTDGSALLGA